MHVAVKIKWERVCVGESVGERVWKREGVGECGRECVEECGTECVGQNV